MTDFTAAAKYPESLLLQGAAASVWGGSDAKITIQIAVSSVLNAELLKLLGCEVETVS